MVIAISTITAKGQSVVIKSNSSGVVVGGSNTRSTNDQEDVEVRTTPLVPGPITPGISVPGTSPSVLRGGSDLGTRVQTTPRTTQDPAPVVMNPVDINVDPPKVNVAKIKRRGELARELNALEGGVDAKVLLRAGNMFDNETGNVQEGAYQLLGKVSEYINVVPFKTVSVTYIKSKEGTNTTSALLRTSALVSWLKNFGSVTGKTISVKEPEFNEQTEVKAIDLENGGEAFGEFVVIHLK